MKRLISRFLIFYFLLPLCASAQDVLLKQIDGVAVMDNTGYRVAIVGDMNADGMGDFIVSTSGFDGIAGNDSGLIVVYSGADHSIIHSIEGFAASSFFGKGLAALGDVNADGVEDFIVGAPDENAGAGSSQGVARVLSGLNGSTIHTVQGDSSFNSFGSAVASLGDVNGDSVDDFVVGAPDVDFNMVTTSSGMVRGFSGADASVLFTITHNIAFARFGSAVSGLDDTNGDSVPEVLVGAPTENSEGKVFVFDISGVPTEIWSETPTVADLLNGDQLGYSVAGLSDLNSDSVPDVLVGSPHSSIPDGFVRVYSGSDGAIIDTIAPGGSNTAKFGASVAFAGEMNADGIGDFLVGGTALGTNFEGEVVLYSGADRSELFRQTGAVMADQFGHSVSGGRDTNGDGSPEILVGSPFAAQGANSFAGLAQLWAYDQCPGDNAKIAVEQCGCGNLETDTDADGTADCVDSCPSDAAKTVPEQCGCGNLETDTDGDGTADCVDNCPSDPNKTDPLICGCGTDENDTTLDSDGDGVPNCAEACDLDPQKTDPGVCGCDIADVDSDGDASLDCNDRCASDPLKTDPGGCGCGTADDEITLDSDGDGVTDCTESCDDDPAKSDSGLCGCGVGEDVSDDDGDGIVNCLDECPTDPVTSRLCGCFQPDSVCDGSSPLFTPETQIVDPPETEVQLPVGKRRKGKVTIILPDFSGATLDLPEEILRLFSEDVQQQIKRLAARLGSDGRLTFQYSTSVKKVVPSRGSGTSFKAQRKKRKKKRRGKAKRVTFGNLRAGTYEATFRVLIVRKKKNGTRRVVAKSNESPPQIFTITDSEST